MTRHDSESLPNFLIVGAAKSGTTRLYDDLAEHPQTFMPTVKEPGILLKASTIEKARSDYARHFAGRQAGALCGEGTTAYTALPDYPSVAVFARQVIPGDLKVLYIVRDPIERIKSHLMHNAIVGRIESEQIDKMVFADPAYLEWSRYDRQIKPWIDTFGESAVMCIKFEDFVSDRQHHFEHVCNFLGLERYVLRDTKSVSNAKGALGRARFQALDPITHTQFYKLHLSRWLPAGAREFAKKLFRKQVEPPEWELSQAAINRIKEAVGDSVSRVMNSGAVTIDDFGDVACESATAKQ